MSDDLTKAAKDAEVRHLVERAAHYSKSVIKEETRKRYAQEFRQFRAWAEPRGFPVLPSEVPVVACYLAALADGAVEVRWTDASGRERVRKAPYKYSSIQYVYTSILATHRAAGHDWPHQIPAIVAVMRGIAARKGKRLRKMTPLKIDDLRRVLGKMRERRYEDLTIVRDRALLSLCFFGAFRRSELVALTVEDLTWEARGLVILVRKSKTDRLAEGEIVGVRPQKDPKVCPVVLLKDWLAKSEITTGPIFRRIDRNGCIGVRPLTGQAVAYIVKGHVERVGLDPDEFAGHSLRAGFATSAAGKGRNLVNIMRQGRWKDQRVAMSYIRPATVLDDNATEGLGDDDGE